MTERQELGSLEAMLFAHAEPVETARLADALRLDTDETAELLQKLQKLYDERESGMVLLYFEPDRWQMTTRRRCTAKHRKTASRRKQRTTTASWNGSDCLWPFFSSSCG